MATKKKAAKKRASVRSRTRTKTKVKDGVETTVTKTRTRTADGKRKTKTRTRRELTVAEYLELPRAKGLPEPVSDAVLGDRAPEKCVWFYRMEGPRKFKARFCVPPNAEPVPVTLSDGTKSVRFVGSRPCVLVLAPGEEDKPVPVEQEQELRRIFEAYG